MNKLIATPKEYVPLLVDIDALYDFSDSEGEFVLMDLRVEKGVCDE